MTAIEPELVVTFELLIDTPQAKSVPFAASPVIVTLPAPVAEMLAEKARATPLESVLVPQEVPLTVIEPAFVLTFELMVVTPLAKSVPFVAVPVMVTLPVPVAEMLEDEIR